MVISHWSLVKRQRLRKENENWSRGALNLTIQFTITASRTSPAGKQSPSGKMSKEVEKRDRDRRQETVSRKLVWLFVIWSLEFGILLI